jgi:hypothetical protein
MKYLLLCFFIISANAEEIKFGQLNGTILTIKLKNLKISRDGKRHLIQVNQECEPNKCLAYKNFLSSLKFKQNTDTHRPSIEICQKKLSGVVVSAMNDRSQYNSYCQFKDKSLISLNSF